MSGKNIVMVVVIVAALVVAGVIVTGQITKDSTPGEGMDRLVHFACRDCQKDFTLTLAEVTAEGGGAVNCANCGSIATTRGEPCYSCERVIITTGHGEMPTKCPHCQASLNPNTGTP